MDDHDFKMPRPHTMTTLEVVDPFSLTPIPWRCEDMEQLDQDHKNPSKALFYAFDADLRHIAITVGKSFDTEKEYPHNLLHNGMYFGRSFVIRITPKIGDPAFHGGHAITSLQVKMVIPPPDNLAWKLGVSLSPGPDRNRQPLQELATGFCAFVPLDPPLLICRDGPLYVNFFAHRLGVDMFRKDP